MNILLNLALVLQILSAIALVVIILLQHGKGADMGAAFGSGGSGSLFGASGSANFLSHATAILAVIFLGTTLALAHFGYAPSSASNGSVLDRFPTSAPAAPAVGQPAPAAPTPEAGPAAQIPESAAGAGSKPAESPAPAANGGAAAPAGAAGQIPTK